MSPKTVSSAGFNGQWFQGEKCGTIFLKMKIKLILGKVGNLTSNYYILKLKCIGIEHNINFDNEILPMYNFKNFNI